MRHRRSLSPGIALSLALVLIACSAGPLRAAQQVEPSAATAQSNIPAAVVKLEGTIDNYNRDHFFKRFNKAKATGAKTIVVDLDTYGGLVTAGLEISRFIKSQSDVRTVAFVGPNANAISAGAMIALACDEIVMGPGAMLGDCAPIAINRGELVTMGDEERRKAVGPILADFEHSARDNKYPLPLVEAMVIGNKVVHWVENPDGERRFVGPNQLKELAAAGWTEVKDPDVRSPVDDEHTLLTVTASTAVKLGLAREEQPSIQALATARNWNVVGTFAPHWGDQIIEWLGYPLIRMLLIMLFATSLWAALHAPGHGFAEVLAMIALALLVGVPLLTGYAQWWEIIVILIGVALLALELFVLPGFGFAGILGIICVLFGLVMTFVGQEPASPKGPSVLPTLQGTWTSLRHGLMAVVAAMAGSLVLAVWLRKFLPKMPYFNRLILSTVAGDIHAGDNTTTAPMQRIGDRFMPAVGAFADAISDLRPGGSAAFYDPTIADVRVLSVISSAGYIKNGQKLVVLDNSDNRILVRAATDAESGHRPH